MSHTDLLYSLPFLWYHKMSLTNDQMPSLSDLSVFHRATQLRDKHSRSGPTCFFLSLSTGEKVYVAGFACNTILILPK